MYGDQLENDVSRRDNKGVKVKVRDEQEGKEKVLWESQLKRIKGWLQ